MLGSKQEREAEPRQKKSLTYMVHHGLFFSSSILFVSAKVGKLGEVGNLLSANNASHTVDYWMRER